MPKKQWAKSVASQWGLFLPPTRPSLSELAFIEKYILSLKIKRKNFTVGILGSTPEYRDLCQTYGINYKCIDYSSSNFTELGRFLRHKDTEKNLIISDWRAMKFKDSFDLFLGDHATAVVPVNEHKKVFRNIKKHCKPSAKVILKIAWRNNNRNLTHKQIFESYRKKYYYLNPFSATWRDVVLADYNFKEDAMHCQKSIESLTKSFQDGYITDYEYKEVKKRWEVLGNFQINIPLKDDFIKKVSEHFTVKKITSGNDWYRKQYPVLILSV